MSTTTRALIVILSVLWVLLATTFATYIYDLRPVFQPLRVSGNLVLAVAQATSALALAVLAIFMWRVAVSQYQVQKTAQVFELAPLVLSPDQSFYRRRPGGQCAGTLMNLGRGPALSLVATFGVTLGGERQRGGFTTCAVHVLPVTHLRPGEAAEVIIPSAYPVIKGSVDNRRDDFVVLHYRDAFGRTWHTVGQVTVFSHGDTVHVDEVFRPDAPGSRLVHHCIQCESERRGLGGPTRQDPDPGPHGWITIKPPGGGGKDGQGGEGEGERPS